MVTVLGKNGKKVKFSLITSWRRMGEPRYSSTHSQPRR